jgi:hypothetical protein
MLVVGSKPFEETLSGLDAEGVGILGEVTVLEHVVNVVPDRFEWNTELAVVVHHLFSLTPVLVALIRESVYFVRLS